MQAIARTIATWWDHFSCRLRQARRVRRDLRELAQMDDRELADLGISHAALAAVVPGRGGPCGRPRFGLASPHI